MSAGLPKPNENIKTVYLTLRIKVIYLSPQYVGTRTKLTELVRWNKVHIYGENLTGKRNNLSLFKLVRDYMEPT